MFPLALTGCMTIPVVNGLITFVNYMCRFLLYPLFLLLASCHAGVYKHHQPMQKQGRGEANDLPVNALNPETKPAEPLWVVSGKDEPSDTFYYPPVEEAYAARLLTAGVYHSDEVDSALLAQPWLGLFKGINGYYLKPARIHAERVEDAVLDEDGQKTGWEITTGGADSSVVLLSGVEGLQKGAVDVIALPKKQLLPEEEVVFSFNGKSYRLYAIGDKKEADGEAIINNYKLFLQYKVDGKNHSQLLVSHPKLDEAMAQLLFAGYLNRDGLPDLLLDTTWHYNAMVPTLYLSKAGGRGALLQVVALHMSVGC